MYFYIAPERNDESFSKIEALSNKPCIGEAVSEKSVSTSETAKLSQNGTPTFKRLNMEFGTPTYKKTVIAGNVSNKEIIVTFF